MRLAVFRSHSLGKSTFMRNPFAASTRKVMTSNFARNLTDCTMAFSFFYNISRVKIYNQTSDNVIFNRSPIDYLAYSQYTANHGTTDIDNHFVETMIAAVRDSLKNIDLLAFIPICNAWPIAMEDDDIRRVDLPYRDEVDGIFKQIHHNHRFTVGIPPGTCSTPRCCDSPTAAIKRADGDICTPTTHTKT